MVFLASSAIMGLNHSTPGCACTPGVDASREEGTSPDSRQLFYLLPPHPEQEPLSGDFSTHAVTRTASE